MELFEQGQLQEAQQLQLLLVNMIREMVKFSPIPAQKAIMEMLGFDLGPLRLPLVSLTEQEKEKLKGSLESIGFFEALKEKHHEEK